MKSVAIIGSGIVGSAIAFQLSKIDGVEVTIFDRHFPASGSTGAALGVLMGVISRKTKGRAWRFRQASMRGYDSLIAELETVTEVTIPYNRQGIVLLRFDLEDQERWEKLIQKRAEASWQLELWDTTKLRQECPQIENEQVVGAIYSPQDRQVNPTILTESLVKAAQIQGLTCRFGVEVKKITPTASQVQLDTTEGIFSYDQLVLSAGLGSMALVKDYEPLHLRPVLGQALRVKLPNGLGNSQFQPVLTGNDIHIVPLGAGEYWVGATVEFPDEEDVVIAQEGLLLALRENAIALCPDLAKAQVLETWSGKRPRPEGRSAPVIQQLPNYPQIILATGHYRNGVLLAPATAEAVVELLY